MSGKFVPPPRLEFEQDEEGYIRIRREQWEQLITWLENYMLFIDENYT